MPRPQAKIDKAQLQALLRLNPTLADTAAFFEVSPDTIERFIKRTWKVGFADFRDQNMVHTRLSLVRKAVEMAKGGDRTMLIWCTKNLCGWKEKAEVTGKDGEPLQGAQVMVTMPSNGREAS